MSGYRARIQLFGFIENVEGVIEDFTDLGWIGFPAGVRLLDVKAAEIFQRLRRPRIQLPRRVVFSFGITVAVHLLINRAESVVSREEIRSSLHDGFKTLACPGGVSFAVVLASLPIFIQYFPGILPAQFRNVDYIRLGT